MGSCVFSLSLQRFMRNMKTEFLHTVAMHGLFVYSLENNNNIIWIK